jgi:glycerophosphoryl diester phosphodiesterase
MVAIIAHRGASNSERENTVAAFRRAVHMGADGVELDVRRSRDGLLIVHHDPCFTDHTGAETVIRSVDAAALPGHIATLSEALEAAQGAFVNVEIKNSPSEPDFDPDLEIVAAVVEALGNWDTTGWVISSFDRATIDEVRRRGPHLVTAWLAVEAQVPDLDDLVAAGHAGIHPWVHGLTHDLVIQAQHRGLFVNTWTCNDPDRIRELAAWGVDGIVTDVPDQALLALSRAG